MSYATRDEMYQVHQKEIDAFPLVFAFNDEQFREGITKTWGLDASNPDDLKQIRKLPMNGGFILAKDVKRFLELLDRHDKEKKEFANSFKNLVDIIVYEMNNHEYSYCPYEVEDEIRDTLETYQNHPRFEEAWNKAKCKVLKAAGYEAYQ